MKIKRFVAAGNLDDTTWGNAEDTEELIDQCAELMNDDINAQDILGTIVFEGDDGNFYTASLQVEISKIDKDLAKLLADSVGDNDGWRRCLQPGDQVYWNDPDGGKTSRYLDIQNIEYGVAGYDTARITTKEGDVVECHLSELS